MDIQEVRARRLKLAADISELVSAFQRETQLTVANLELTHFMTDAAQVPITTKVDITLSLD